MSYDLSDYVDVAERLKTAFERYPEGSMQGTGEFVRDEENRIIGYLYRAAFYRTPSDECPGIGTAYEPIPGKTPYTRDSEVQNAETSAWGRAVIASGFPSKKIASADEVRARQSAGEPSAARPVSEPEPNDRVASSGVEASPAEAMVNKAMEAQYAHERPSGPPEDDGKPENVVITFGKHKGMKLGQVPSAYLSWLVEKFEAKNAEQRRILTAAMNLTGKALVSDDPYPDIPF